VNTNPSGLIFFSDFVGTGGGFQYIQRVADAAAPDGDIVFRNVLLESSATDFFALTDPGSFSLPSFDAVTIDHCAIEDPTGSNQALINYEIASCTLSVVYINHSYSSANTGVAIRMTNGTLAESFVFGCESSCNTQVVNSSGVPIAGATASNLYGFDYVVNVSDASRLRSDPWEGSSGGSPDEGPAARFTPGGSSFARMALDPAEGLLFNGTASYGFDSQLYQSASNPDTLDVGFASLMAPTNLAGTPAIGGSLAHGTYYYFIASCTSSACSTYSVPSQPSAAVSVSGSNDAVNLTWTAPAAGAGTIGGFLIWRCASPSVGCINSSSDTTISGTSSATSYTDNGFSGCCWTNPPVAPMQSVHRFTPTSLGIGTISPAYNLDVTGTGRFTGSVNVAGLNDSALAASSSVCTDGSKNLTTTGCSSGGSGTPGGSNTQFQYDNSGSFAGAANLTYSSNATTVTANSSSTTPLTIVAAGGQTASLLHFQNSSGAALWDFNPSGFTLASNTYPASLQFPGGASGTTSLAMATKGFAIGLDSLTAPASGLSLTNNFAVFGSSNDTFFQEVADGGSFTSSQWNAFEGYGGAGLILSTVTSSSAGPVSIRPNRTETARFPSGGGEKFVALTVSTLPAASSNAGMIPVVSDSTTISSEGQTCSGGSSNYALAFSNGSIWKCF